MKLIGLTGKMHSGKSTALDQIIDLSRCRIVKSKLAAPLYEMQEMLYNRILSVYKRPDDFVKDRKLLQFLGTDWGRYTIDQDIWVKLWKKEVEEISGEDTIVIVDDVRFDNEAKAIKDMSGIVVKIERETNNSKFSRHESEHGVDFRYIDCVVENNGTVDDLRESLLTLNSIYLLW